MAFDRTSLVDELNESANEVLLGDDQIVRFLAEAPDEEVNALYEETRRTLVEQNPEKYSTEVEVPALSPQRIAELRQRQSRMTSGINKVFANQRAKEQLEDIERQIAETKKVRVPLFDKNTENVLSIVTSEDFNLEDLTSKELLQLRATLPLDQIAPDVWEKTIEIGKKRAGLEGEGESTASLDTSRLIAFTRGALPFGKKIFGRDDLADTNLALADPSFENTETTGAIISLIYGGAAAGTQVGKIPKVGKIGQIGLRALTEGALGVAYADSAPGLLAELSNKPDDYTLNFLEAVAISSVFDFGASAWRAFRGRTVGDVLPEITEGNKPKAKSKEIKTKQLEQEAAQQATKDVTNIPVDNPDLAVRLTELTSKNKEIQQSTADFLAKSELPSAKKKTGGLAERLARSKETPAEESKRLLSDDVLKTERQTQSAVEDLVQSMSNDELVASLKLNKGVVPGNENVSTAAGIELLNRTRSSGGNTGPLFELLNRRGTAIGQLANQYAMFRTATPEGLVGIAKDAADERGLKLLKEQEDKLYDLGAKRIDTERAYKLAGERLLDDYNDINHKRFNEAKNTAGKALREFNDFNDSIFTDDFFDILSKILQGNLLAPLSQLANITTNVFQLPVRAKVSIISAALDTMLGLTGRARTRATGPSIALANVTNSAKGLAEASREFLTGPSADTLIKGEFIKGFRPLNAWRQFITGKDLAVSAKTGKPRFSDRAKRLIEGTVGIPAEVMFRGLNLGDKPVRRGAQGGAIEEYIKLRGLKGNDAKAFRAFQPDNILKDIDELSREAIFAQSSKFGRSLNRILDNDIAEAIGVDGVPVLRGAIKFFNKLQVPFRQFPINYAIKLLDFAVPMWSIPKGAMLTALGKQRQGTEAIASGIIGYSIMAAADYLYEDGLVSEPVVGNNVPQASKIRSAQYEGMGPGRINVSGIRRLKAGEDPSWRGGDVTIGIEKLGMPGMLVALRAKMRAETDRKVASDPDFVIPEGELGKEWARQTAQLPGVFNLLVDQTFLAGTSAFLDAVSDPTGPAMQQWQGNMWRAITSTVVPNTVEAISRAQYEYIPELRGDSTNDTLKNIWEFKVNPIKKAYSEGDEFLPKRNLWGEPIDRTPEGANPWVYNLFDPTKAKADTPEPWKEKIYNIFETTDSVAAYPTPPEPYFTNPVTGDRIKIERQDYDTLLEISGGVSAAIAQQVVSPYSLDDFRTNPMQPITNVELLQDLQSQYRKGNEAVRREFQASPGFAEKYFAPQPDGSPNKFTVKIGPVTKIIDTIEQTQMDAAAREYLKGTDNTEID